MSARERLGFDAFLVLVFIATGLTSLSFDPAARVLPLSVSVAGVILMLAQGGIDVRSRLAATPASADQDGRTAAGQFAGSSQGVRQSDPGESETGWYGPLRSFFWLGAFVFLLWLIGYLLATPIFALAYMVIAGRVRWLTALGVTAGIWVSMYLLLEVVLNISP